MILRILLHSLPLIGVLFLTLGGAATAQTSTPRDSTTNSPAYLVAYDSFYPEQLPELPGGGGTRAILEQIYSFLKMPPEVQQGAIDGRLFVNFIVAADGAVTNMRIVKGLSPACDAAALAALARLPRLVPGQNNGRAVAVPFTLPIDFYGPAHVYEDAAHPARFPAPGVRAYIRRKLRRAVGFQKTTHFGELQISYVVGADGRVRDAHLESTASDEHYGQELLRLVQAMPAWQPAHNAQGQAVAVRAYLQVRLPAGKVSTGRPSFRPQDLRN